MEKKTYPFFYDGKKQEFGKAAIAGDIVFLSGVSGREWGTGEVKEPDVRTQTRTAWHKIESILQEVGSSLNGIVKIVIYLRDVKDYDAFYEEKCKFLEVHCPELLRNPVAETLVEAGLYKKDMLVEIDIIAILAK
jgi:2-iminobutanoate/2-iminopropanoate deaminase